MITIASSNLNKLKEYKKLFPKIKTQQIDDLKEILSNKDDVMIYKVKQLNQFNVVLEDTILEIYENDQYVEIVDIKFKIKELKKSLKARWVVSLGFMKDGKICISRATLDGTINPEKYVENTFGFDSIFIPQRTTQTLYELDQKGLKDHYNVRKDALNDLMLGVYYKVVEVKSIKPWTGAYQK